MHRTKAGKPDLVTPHFKGPILGVGAGFRPPATTSALAPNLNFGNLTVDCFFDFLESRVGKAFRGATF